MTKAGEFLPKTIKSLGPKNKNNFHSPHLIQKDTYVLLIKDT